MLLIQRVSEAMFERTAIIEIPPRGLGVLGCSALQVVNYCRQVGHRVPVRR